MPFDLNLAQSLWIGFGMFLAGYVRGYSGFGFAALVVSTASLVTNPMLFVPVVLLADFFLTAQQARGIWRAIEWRRVATLFLGCLAGAPLGVWVLAATGADTARAAISVFVLLICGLLFAGWRLARAPGDLAHVGTGVISGVANGAAIGGLPVAVFFAAQTMAAASFRATAIIYFTLLDLWTIPIMAWNGMIGRETLIATAMGLPIMVLGVWFGSRQFLNANPQSFRRFAILLLAALASLGLVKTVL